MKCRLLAGVAFGMVLLFTSTARADEGSKQEASVQGFGFFTKNSTGRGLRQTSTNGGGFLLGYRYHFNRWLGAEVNYGRTRDTTRTITTTPTLLPISPVFGPGPRVLTTTLPVQADIHEATAAAVVTVPSFGRLKPYVLAGSGALTFVPTQNAGGFVPGAGNKAQAVFLYGGGADYDFTRHFAFRLEYRGFVYKRPDFGLITLRSDATTHTAQPSAGIVFRF
jgi:opacity protein-like surface antigen